MTIPPARPRIALADGQRLVLEALARSVSAVATVVGIATDGATLLEVVESTRPGIVLTDDLLPGLPGLEAIRRLRGPHGTASAVIVLRSLAEPAFGRAARDAGAAGLLSRDASVEELWEAIATVARGGRHLGPAWGRAEDGGAPTPSPALTDREAEILSLVAQGLTAAAIARRLGISGRTVNFHKQNLRARLGVSTTVEAVAWLGRQGR